MRSSDTMSTTLVFLTSGQFSLKVRPRTRTRAPFGWMPLPSIRLTMREARTLIELNGQAISDTDQLRARLEEILALGVQPPVIIDPSPQITMNVAVEAYDTARLAGADRVLFAARPEE